MSTIRQVNSPAERVPHIPGSRYAVELKRGARDMRFSPELEHEYLRFYLETARYASLVISLVAAVEVAHRIHAGAGEVFALLTPYSIGLYFLAGILYRAALQANIVMIIALPRRSPISASLLRSSPR